ncbi:MAG TPA: ATP-grasp domain-containing protein [Pseudoxanthomonas sp.]
MPNVLILGGRAPVALDHARRFQRQGWKVHVADSIPCRLTGWSRSVAATLPLASPRYAPMAFAEGIRAAIRTHAIDLVVPTCEEVFYLSRYRNLLPAEVRVLAGDFDTLRTLHSKWHFIEAAQGCAAAVPESRRVASLAEARAWAGAEPVVLKPEYSRFGVHVRIHPEGLPMRAKELDVAGAWVAQRYHAGTELCSYGIASEGRLLAHAVYRPSYRIQRSSSYYFEPHACEKIRGFVSSFVRKMNFTGQISFDWIQGEDGEATVIECNPRATSGLHLFADDDALPAALMGAAGDCVEPSRTQPAMIAALMLSAGLYQAMAGSTLPRWRHDYRRARDVITRRQDRSPLAGGLLDLGSYSRLAIRQGCNLREAATRDIEWDGECLSPT